MNSAPKKIIAFLITIFILILMYQGAYLPLRKSQLYIDAISQLQSGAIHSLQDFAGVFDLALGYYSPIGQDEEVSYYTGGVLANIINQQSNPGVVDALLKDAERWMNPIINAGKGIGYSQNLYNFAMIYQMASQKLKNVDYLNKSVDLFYQGLENSPNREIFLEGLLNDYEIGGDTAKAKEVGKTILKYWPDKQDIQKFINDN